MLFVHDRLHEMNWEILFSGYGLIKELPFGFTLKMSGTRVWTGWGARS